MKKILFLLLPVFLTTGCFPEDVAIRTEKRIEVSGRVLQHSSSNPIARISVISYGVLGGNFIADNSHRLGFGKTSAEGIFKFVSLDTRNGKFAMSVNPSTGDLYNPEYATFNFIETNRPGTVLRFGDIELPRVVVFNFAISNTSGTPEELNYKITHTKNQLFFDLRVRDISLDSSENFREENLYIIHGRHSNTQETFVRLIESIEGTNLKFTYSLGDEESQELIIPITSQTSDYVFEY